MKKIVRGFRVILKLLLDGPHPTVPIAIANDQTLGDVHAQQRMPHLNMFAVFLLLPSLLYLLNHSVPLTASKFRCHF